MDLFSNVGPGYIPIIDLETTTSCLGDKYQLPHYQETFGYFLHSFPVTNPKKNQGSKLSRRERRSTWSFVEDSTIIGSPATSGEDKLMKVIEPSSNGRSCGTCQVPNLGSRENSCSVMLRTMPSLSKPLERRRLRPPKNPLHLTHLTWCVSSKRLSFREAQVSATSPPVPVHPWQSSDTQNSVYEWTERRGTSAG